MSPRAIGITGALALAFAAAVGAGAFSTGTVPGVLQSSLVNSAATTYYVDAAGNDGNACTSLASPCLTCQGALNKIPRRLRYPAKVLFSAGTFAGCNVEGFSVESLYAANADTTYPGMLIVEGTLSAYTLATGLQTGTVASATAESSTAFGTATVPGAGWTTNDLAGRIFHTLAGTGSGQYLQIASNTATVVTFTGAPTTLGGTTTFEIVTPGTVINTATAPATQEIQISNVGLASQAPSNTLSTLVRFIRFTGAFNAVVVASTGTSTIDNCRFENSTSAILTGNGVVTIRRNAFVGSGGAAGIASTGGAGKVTITGNYFTGTGTLLSAFGASAPLSFVSDRNYVAASTSLARFGQGSSWSSTRDRVAAASSACVQFGDTAGGSALRSSNGRFDVTNSDFSNCIGGALDIAGTVTGLLSSVTGTGSTGYGITATYGAHVEITSGTTVTGTTNDTLIDGTAYSYTTLRGLSPKAEPSAANVYGTVVYER